MLQDCATRNHFPIAQYYMWYSINNVQKRERWGRGKGEIKRQERDRDREKDSNQSTFETFRNVKDSKDHVGNFRKFY